MRLNQLAINFCAWTMLDNATDKKHVYDIIFAQKCMNKQVPYDCDTDSWQVRNPQIYVISASKYKIN